MIQWTDFEPLQTTFFVEQSKACFCLCGSQLYYVSLDGVYWICFFVVVWQLNMGSRSWVLGSCSSDCAQYCLLHLASIPTAYTFLHMIYSQELVCWKSQFLASLRMESWIFSISVSLTSEMYLSEFFRGKRQPKQLRLNTDSSWSHAYHLPSSSLIWNS